MKAILSKYKYEIYFFYALPGLGTILGGLIYLLMPNSIQSGFSGLWTLFFIVLVQLSVFGIAYRVVRRLERPFLVAMWQGKMALLVLALVFVILQHLLVWGEPGEIARLRIVGLLEAALVVAVTSWFAAKVSRQRFQRAAAYVALMFFYGPPFYYAITYIISGNATVQFDFPALATSILLLIMGVRALRREGDVGKAGLALLFIASWLSFVNIFVSSLNRGVTEDIWWNVVLRWETWYTTLPLFPTQATYMLGTVCLAYLLYRYLRPIQGGRVGRMLWGVS